VNEIPQRGFYVDTNGRIYLDGVRTTRSSLSGPAYRGPYKAVIKKPGEHITKPDTPAKDNFKELQDKMVDEFRHAAKGLAKAWDRGCQNGEWADKEDDKEYEKEREAEMGAVYDGRQVTFTANGSQAMPRLEKDCVGDEVIELQANVGELTDIVTDIVETDLGLIKVQTDSMQKQLSALQSVDIDDDYEGEKLDSFKTRTKDAIQEAGFVLDDMENADRMLQAREMKRACLAENKRRNIGAQLTVQERLAKLRDTHDEIRKERANKAPLWKTCMVVLFGVLLAIAMLVAIILVL